MENNIAIAPSRKQKTEIDYSYCIICQQHLASERTVTTLKPKSIETMLKPTRTMPKQSRMGRPQKGRNLTYIVFKLARSKLNPSTHLGSPVALSLTPDFLDASPLRLQKTKNILDATKNL